MSSQLFARLNTQNGISLNESRNSSDGLNFRDEQGSFGGARPLSLRPFPLTLGSSNGALVFYTASAFRLAGAS